MSAGRRKQLSLLFLMVVAGAIAEIATIAMVVPFLSLLSGGEGFGLALFERVFGGLGSPEQQLLSATLAFATAAVLAGFARIALTWMTQSFSFGFGHDLALRIQTKLLYQSYAFHTSTNSGDLIAIHEKVFAFIHGTVLPALNGLTAAITSLFIIAILTYLDPAATGLAVAAVAALYLGVTWISRGRLRRYGEALNNSHTERVRAVQESLGGIRDVILDQSQPAHLAHFAQISRRYARSEMLAAFVSATPRYAIEAIGMVLIAGFAVVLARGGNFAAALPILGAMALSAQRLLPLLQQVYQGWAQVRAGTAYASDIASMPRLDDSATFETIDLPVPLPFEREIRLDGVRFQYPSNREIVFDELDLIIEHGSRTALVGDTGSGKSTLLDLLMGLIDAGGGSVAIDGVRLTNERRRAWQMQVAHVPQAIFLADASIIRNIAFGQADKDIDLDRVRWAARLAEAHDFIHRLPAGYQTEVGERGVRLSGGQRQRIGIARALYKRASVLILDEATSALDAQTESKVLENILGLGRGRTLIMVAHRHSSLDCCDSVVRLENGRIAKVENRIEERPLVRSAI
ncbi:ABC transporter ATP-binding protein [Sphingomonas daechungensis]|uniref:ABC transporter ATP-binding protein n=1 Tax=Sphingomonas daechungensis TaxID=1176646 RepID=UPI003782F1EB